MALLAPPAAAALEPLPLPLLFTKLASKLLLSSGSSMLAAARQTVLHTAGPEVLLEETSTATTSTAEVAGALRTTATGELAAVSSTAAGIGASARVAVAESAGQLLGRAEAGAAGPLAARSLLAAEESLTTLRADASNAFQAGLEDVLDTNPNLSLNSVTEQAKTLLPSFTA